MGYYVKSKKINITLDEHQQKEIFDIWMNPSDSLRSTNFAIGILSPVFNAENALYNEKKATDIRDILDMVGVECEETKKGLKLKYHEAKYRHQRDLFSAVAHIISPGSFLTLRGEDGTLIGYFFNGKELIDYSSYEQLKELETPFKLKKELEKILTNKSVSNKTKMKV